MKCLQILVCLVLACGPLAAQQFQEQAGAIPGPVVWTESCEALDANGDGWMDVIFTNGQGFSSAQGALKPTLLINQAVPGAAVFADETASRIPASFFQQGKGMTVCDVDGDGDEDIVFANAFSTQPRLLINGGTGVFSDQTSTRLPVMFLNSFGVNFGDLDDDGDLDLVIGDNGGKARLLINDGTGVFTDQPTKMNAVIKPGAMQVNIVDVDGDLDLDVIVDGKSSGQQLYLNDGAANFTFMGATLPAGSSLTYETDWADLDNDDDVDGIYISISGFSEGSARNDVNGGTTATFTGTTSTFSGLNSNDDNEAAFIDANDDGLLDVLIASLGNSREKLYLNAGTLATGSLVYQGSSGFSTRFDSTLDLCIADFDRDGRYDVVTGQGESGSFLNRYYENTGAADTTAPRIARVQTLPSFVPVGDLAAGATRVRAWIQDATYDNGRNFIGASLRVTTYKGTFQAMATLPMTAIGGGLFSGVVAPPVPPTGLLGATVDYVVIANDPQANTSSSCTQTFVVDGVDTYDTQLGPASTLTTTWSPAGGLPLATLGTLAVAGATPGGAGLFGVSLARDDTSVFGIPLLIAVDPANLIVSSGFNYGPAGDLIIPMVSRSLAVVADVVLHFQFFEISPAVAASNGLRMRLLP